MGGSDRNTAERSRGTSTNTLDEAGDFLFAGSRGAGGLRGAGGHSVGGRSLLSTDVGVNGSWSSAAFVPSADARAGDGEAEADDGEGDKGAVLIGGSAGRASSAGEAIAAARIGGEFAGEAGRMGSNSCSSKGARSG